MHESDEGAESDVHESDEGAESDAHESDEGAESEESDEDAESEASDSDAGVAVGKRKRGAVLKTFNCPACHLKIELTQLRTHEVQCGECGEWVSHNWTENHGKVQGDVKRLRENHFKVVAYAACTDKESRKAEQKAKRDAKPKLTQDELEARRAKGRATMAQRKIDGKGPTPEQIAQGNKRRQEALEADSDRHARSNAAQRERKRRRLANESEEDKAKRLKSEADRAAYDRKLLTDEQKASVNKRNAECMRQARIADPAKFKAIDKAKHEKRMEDPAKRQLYNAKRTLKARQKRERERLAKIAAGTGAKAVTDQADDGQTEAMSAALAALATPGSSSGYKKCGTCEMAVATTFDDCWPCRTGAKRVKKFEQEVLAVLVTEKLYWSTYNLQGPCTGKDETRRIADIVYGAEEMSYTVILEIDEDYHRSYTPECETVRMQQLREKYPSKPVFFVRYHPIRCQIKKGLVTHPGQIRDSSKKELIACMKTIFALPPPGEDDLPCGYNVVFLGYPDARVAELASKRESMQHAAMQVILAEKKNRDRLAAHAQAQARVRAGASSSSK